MIKDITNLSNESSPKYRFDLDKQLINCDIEEIQGIIYFCLRKKISKDSLQEKVLKKIVPTFSQDILASIKFSNFENKYPGVTKSIFDIYNEGEHSNLSNFLLKTNNLKNVVYTFSNIHEKIIIQNEIKNEN
jgi:hypothetical protein